VDGRLGTYYLVGNPVFAVVAPTEGPPE